MSLKKFIPALLVLLVFVQASATPGLNDEKLPLSWYQKPEDMPLNADAFARYGAGSAQKDSGQDRADEEAERFDEPGSSAGAMFERALGSQGMLMSRIAAAPGSEAASAPPGRPKDWIPWQLTFFTTELGVSLQGLLGLLTVRGSPAVIAMWRKQGPVVADTSESVSSSAPAERTSPPLEAPIEVSEAGVTPLQSAETADGVLAQMEPAVQAAVAAGTLREGPVLRRNLHGIAERMHEMIRALELADNPGTEWWVSGLRFDLILDVSGRLGGAGPTGGVETRLYFDWRRAIRNGARPHPRRPIDTELGLKVQKFAIRVAKDLEASASTLLDGKGYEPFTYRVGVGVSARGDIGLVTGGALAIGQLRYGRNAERPAVRPPQPRLVTASSALGESADDEDYLLIEGNASSVHWSAATALGVPFEKFERIGRRETVYKVTRSRIRKGLRKSAKIASFFIRHAPASMSKDAAGWKIYIMRLLFDWSITGNAGLVAVGGLPSIELQFYNRNF